MLVAHRAHDRGERGHLGLGQAGRGLVHEHEARLGRQRAGHAEPALVAVGSAPAGRVGVARQAEQLEQLGRAPPRRPRAEAPTPSAATSTFSRTLRPAERVPVLERAGEPVRARGGALQRVMSRSSELDAPGGRAGRSR